MTDSHLFHKWGRGVGPDLPRIDRARDEFLFTADGERIVDAASGAAVVNLGHSVPNVGDVVSDQLADVSYVSLSHFRHDAPEALAAKLAEIAPGSLNTAFFVNSGSEGNETAFKLARAYHQS
ncbi:MAG: aminotransferase class III-fold pyridoxal phosphate-dependent enzyme, partial [Halobacteriota archaeon]